MMPLVERRDELDAVPDVHLVRILTRKNPFGGYSIGKGRGQLTRQSAIETILRYEGYKQAEIESTRHA